MRIDLERRRLHKRRWPLDDLSIRAFQHLVEREGVLRQGCQHAIVLDLRKGVRAHGKESKNAGIGCKRLAQDVDKALGLGAALLVEQLLALIDREDDNEWRRPLA